LIIEVVAEVHEARILIGELLILKIILEIHFHVAIHISTLVLHLSLLSAQHREGDGFSTHFYCLVHCLGLIHAIFTFQFDFLKMKLCLRRGRCSQVAEFAGLKFEIEFEIAFGRYGLRKLQSCF
jgi:hypothetical protein